MGNLSVSQNSKEENSKIKDVATVNTQEAWELMQHNPIAVLIDVRTQEEWNNTGIPDLSSMNKAPLCISWRLFPNMDVNTRFIVEVSNKINDKNTTLLFLCRSGMRSHEAAKAMMQKGYVNCYNIGGGVEGIMNMHNRANIAQQSIQGKVVTWPWEHK